MEVVNTFVFPIIRQDFILRALETLKIYTPPNFRTIVVNQSLPNPEFEDRLWRAADIVVRTEKNYGFAQGANIGLRLALPNAEADFDLYQDAGLIVKSQRSPIANEILLLATPYVTVANDDIEFIPAEPSWWAGIMETFERFDGDERPAAAVNPQSTKEPGWGWGEPGFRYLVPNDYPDPELMEVWADWEIARLEYREIRDRVRAERAEKGQEGGDLKKDFAWSRHRLLRYADALAPMVYAHSVTDPEFQRLMTETRNWQVVDAFACWCTVFRADRLEQIGLYDERFMPGGGEDYDWMARCYQAGFRALSSSRSWVWHSWGQSKDAPDGHAAAQPRARPPWNKLSVKGFGDEGLWDPDVDCWGNNCTRMDPVVHRSPL